MATAPAGLLLVSVEQDLGRGIAMARGVHDPEKYCPICGVKLPNAPDPMDKHRCSARTLQGIDAALKRDGTPHPRLLTLDQRLSAGFLMLEDDD